MWRAQSAAGEVRRADAVRHPGSIARSLKEEIPLIKTEDRLSRNLKAAELEAELSSQLASMASKRVESNTVLCLDLSDIRKEYPTGDFSFPQTEL